MAWRSKEGAKLGGCCWKCDGPGAFHSANTRQFMRRSYHKAVRRYLKEEDRKMQENDSVFYPVQCLICEKELKIEDCDRPVVRISGTLSNQITYDGVDCVAYGNYGSSAHDPMGRAPLLSFVICDQCFRSHKHLMFEVEERDPE